MIRKIYYLACDICLEICDGSDADSTREARRIGQRYDRYVRRADPRNPLNRYSDVCPKCQADPGRTYETIAAENAR